MKDFDDAQGQAHGAHTPEAGHLPTDFLFEVFVFWRDTEEEISVLQDSKKTMLANVRKDYGRHQAEALRITMRRAMMDPKKRHEEIIFNEMTSQYGEVLDAEIEARGTEDGQES